jgi:hypothetical protein
MFFDEKWGSDWGRGEFPFGPLLFRFGSSGFSFGSGVVPNGSAVVPNRNCDYTLWVVGCSECGTGVDLLGIVAGCSGNGVF